MSFNRALPVITPPGRTTRQHLDDRTGRVREAVQAGERDDQVEGGVLEGEVPDVGQVSGHLAGDAELLRPREVRSIIRWEMSAATYSTSWPGSSPRRATPPPHGTSRIRAPAGCRPISSAAAYSLPRSLWIPTFQTAPPAWGCSTVQS